ncbi:MFS transporter [Streptomyces lydicus]|nr:MFS transporter [Streptomyces lydicus]
MEVACATVQFRSSWPGPWARPRSLPLRRRPLYPVYQRLWNLSTFTLTVVFAVYVFALLAALLTVGSVSDRVGRRPVACGALVLLALGMLLFAVATGVGGLMAARIVQGLAVGTAAGATTALIMESAPNPRLGSTISSAVPSLGIAIGAVLAGALVEFAPLPRQLVFWILTVVYLVLAALVWLVREKARSDSPTRETIWRSLLPSAQLPRATRPVFVALLPSISATWALAACTSRSDRRSSPPSSTCTATSSRASSSAPSSSPGRRALSRRPSLRHDTAHGSASGPSPLASRSLSQPCRRVYCRSTSSGR